MSKDILSFRDENYFLSNMFPCNVVYDGLTYCSAEAAFQASKTLDVEERKKFTNISGYDAKKLGRTVKLRSDWENVKIGIMQEILEAKFTNPDLKEKLASTGKVRLVEGNTWRDTFWGVDARTGKGMNVLGNLLMDIRNEIQKEMKGNTIMNEKELFGVTEGIICQQCNCRGAYGAGLSGAISDKFPEVYKAFEQFNNLYPNPDEQLGKHHIVVLEQERDGSTKLGVANIFTQRDYGNSAKTGIVYTNTPLLVQNIKEIAEAYPDIPVYVPHAVDKNGKHGGIGCGLAGEKWENLYPQLQALKLDNLYLLDTFTGEREKVKPQPTEKIRKRVRDDYER